MNRFTLIVFLTCLLPPVAVGEPVRLVYVGDPSESAWRGVQQGVIEANILGEFTGQTWVAEVLEGVKPRNLAQPPLAVFTSVRGVTLERLTVRFNGIPIFNLTDDNDDLRRHCRANLLHTAPSAAMKTAALAQWRSKHPEDSPALAARAWHADFVKFAARDLNRRYAEAHGEAMDDDAWSGWAAVKLVVEALTRGGSHDPAALLRTLRDDFEVDGQKGVPLSLRATGQLRQPLLMADGDRLLGEAPVRGVADLEELDSLGPLTCLPLEE